MFITFEGGEGCGKSTVMQQVAASLAATYIKHIRCTREPGGTVTAEQIRNMLLHANDLEKETEALLFAAARRQHLSEIILPALQKGSIVLCDRFIDSSYVYQGIVGGLGIERIHQINAFCENTMPALTIFLDVPPAVGLGRIAQDSTREVNRFDAASLSFHKQVHAGYRTLTKQFPERIRRVDATNDIETVKRDVMVIIEAALAFM